MKTKNTKKIPIAVLKGDGIGPEVIDASLPTLAYAAEKAKLNLDFQEAWVGGAAWDAVGDVDCPVLLLHSTHDSVTSPKSSRDRCRKK